MFELCVEKWKYAWCLSIQKMHSEECKISKAIYLPYKGTKWAIYLPYRVPSGPFISLIGYQVGHLPPL